MTFKEKYGPFALVAGASEGMGAAWAETLAKKGLNLVLIARRKELLDKYSASLMKEYSINVIPVTCDLSHENALQQVHESIGDIKINLLVYNAVLPYIGSFEEQGMEMLMNMEKVNMSAPIKFTYHFGKSMLAEGRGGIILMSSIAGFQGSGFLSMYAATKAFNRVLAEGLWYEWKDKGVDVIACCAGATATPNYINTKPQNTGIFAPAVQSPAAVTEECLRHLGKVPSCITGGGNKAAVFFMNRVLSRKMAINIMGDTTRKMYIK